MYALMLSCPGADHGPCSHTLTSCTAIWHQLDAERAEAAGSTNMPYAPGWFDCQQGVQGPCIRAAQSYKYHADRCRSTETLQGVWLGLSLGKVMGKPYDYALLEAPTYQFSAHGMRYLRAKLASRCQGLPPLAPSSSHDSPACLCCHSAYAKKLSNRLCSALSWYFGCRTPVAETL